MTLSPKVEKASDGTLTIRGLPIWSTGVFHGYGSPPEGDHFTVEDLGEMVRAHREIGARLDPRVYPGHPLNPMLKLFARPKGRITNLYREGNYLLADLEGVDPEFWEAAQKDGARLSPDVRFGYVDPATGKRYNKVVVGLGVLGAVPPANTLLPSLDQFKAHYYAAYGEGDVRTYAWGPSRVDPEKRDDLEGVPDDVYLIPEEKLYPVKQKHGGKWVYSKSDLMDAARLANMHCKKRGGKHCEALKKAKALLKREFGINWGEDKDEEKGKKSSYNLGGSMELEGLKQLLEEVMKADGEERQAAFAALQERIAGLEESLRHALEEEKARRAALEAELEKARALLEAKLVEEVLDEGRAFVDQLVEDMVLPPALRDKALTVLQVLIGVPEKASAYALGELPDGAVEKTPAELFMDFLKALPKAPVAKAVPKDEKQAERAYASQAKLSPQDVVKGGTASAEIRAYAEELMRTEGLRYDEALRRAIREFTS